MAIEVGIAGARRPGAPQVFQPTPDAEAVALSGPDGG